MQDYLVNVGMSFIPYGVWALFIFLLSFIPYYIKILNPGIRLQLKHWIQAAAVFVVLLGTFISVVSTTNTWKNNTIDERTRRNTEIKNQIEHKPVGVISDSTKKPQLTDDQREARFEQLKDYTK